MRFLLTMLIVLIPLCAQDAPPAQKKGGGPPKNLKVLKPEDLQGGIMRVFTQSLGVQCGFCHVQGDNSSDDNPKKLVARNMITLAHDINTKLGVAADGKAKVTCYTCHRGNETPETAAPAAQ